MPELLDDLMGFCNDDSLPALAQAAVAHAQFETIHPFVDGNGRAGRALIHMVLRRRGLGLRILPPVSLILATWSQDYIDGLNGTRYVGPSNSAEAHAGINSWIARFASACNRSTEDAGHFEDRVRELQSGWRGRVGCIRRPLPCSRRRRSSSGGRSRPRALRWSAWWKPACSCRSVSGAAAGPSRRMIWSVHSPCLSAGSRVRRAIPAHRRQLVGCLADRQ